MSNRTPIQLPLPVEGATIKIPLTKGYTTIIDAVDADLAQYKWYAFENGSGAYYARRKIGGRKNTIALLLHRVVLERILGRELKTDEQCDHIDCNPLNNCRSNLRLATQSQNNWNQRRNAVNKSGYKGVTWQKNRSKWAAYIKVHGKNRYLGLFDTAKEAYEARCKAALKYHGEFARFE